MKERGENSCGLPKRYLRVGHGGSLLRPSRDSFVVILPVVVRCYIALKLYTEK
jgi:hypothetical protein